jgi:hypothetical protein
MSGGVTQLVAIGAQDAYIVGSPEVSFFRSSYKRHTNFAHVVSRQVIQGNPTPSNMTSVRFERKGDLLSYVYLTRKENGASVAFGANDIDHIDLLIGGQVVDSQDNFFATGISDIMVSTQQKANADGLSNKYYPIQFWFCQNWQSALPMIALQYHDVEMRIYWSSSLNLSASPAFECWADFIYLDNDERQEFATKTHNILMYQVQKQSLSGTKIQNLVFNQPVKFMAATSNIIYGSETESNTLLLQINGVDVGEPKNYSPHFTTVPIYYTVPWTINSPPGFLYSFCLDTSKLQPTGSLNFSRVDSARLVSTANFTADTSTGSQYIYAVNYNILKIENGMGGLLYAN